MCFFTFRLDEMHHSKTQSPLIFAGVEMKLHFAADVTAFILIFVFLLCGMRVAWQGIADLASKCERFACTRQQVVKQMTVSPRRDESCFFLCAFRVDETVIF